MTRQDALKIWNNVAQGSPIVTGRTLEAFATAVEQAFITVKTNELKNEMMSIHNNAPTDVVGIRNPNEPPSGTIF